MTKILIEIDTDTQRVVPAIPTDEIYTSACDALGILFLSERFDAMYAAMLAAAPQPEPVVAWLSRESESGRICLDVEDSEESGTWSPSFPVYELPPTAEQLEQETAEAIAKMLDDKDVGRTDYRMHVYEEGEQYKSEAIAAVRNGAWKEYK